MKTVNRIFFLVALIMAVVSSMAQKNNADTSVMRTSAFHISFITPVGTNGTESWNTVNKVSFNLFGGYSGGLDGAEFSGFASVLRRDMSGFQLSGFGNVVLGQTEGAQFAGFANYNRRAVKGTQFAGFANVVTDSVSAFQAAGFANVANGNTRGGQLAGFSNFSNGNMTGAQIAGFANVALGDVDGVQLSGFLNVARDVNGLQLGVINVARSVEHGASIGVLSFVKEGYRAVEIGGNESFYGMITFKTGIRQFYNIIALGASVRNDKVNWGWGYGIGTLVPMSQNTDLAIEAISFHVNEDEWFTDRLNLLNRIQATLSWKVNESLAIFGGPSFNVMVSKATDKSGEVITPAIVPWTIYDRIHRDTRVQMYPGFSVGVRL